MIYIKTKTLELISAIMVSVSILVLSILSYGYYLHF
jgi:hypothetical protein